MKKPFYIISIINAFFFIVSCKQSSNIPATVEVTPIAERSGLVTVEITRLVEIQVTVPVEVTREIEILITGAAPVNQQATPKPAANINYSGVYVKSNGKDFYKDGGCVLSVIHEAVQDPFDNLSFELFCTRGEPSYNMGYTIDDILFENHLSKTAVWSSPWGECHLVFGFNEHEVVVSQIGHSFACGFGHAVYANGTYYLKDAAPPNLGCRAIPSLGSTPVPCTYNP